MQKKLAIVASDNQVSGSEAPSHLRKNRRQEAEARFDRLWLIAPQQMNPDRHIMEKERIERTLNAIDKSLEGKRAVDLGCGSGVLARALRSRGAEVDAVDISKNALKLLDDQALHPIQDYVPMTALKDDTYDLVLCTELIGYLPKDEHRLLFSELARLVKSDGIIVCSSAMDIDSVDPVQQFAGLAETELKIDSWHFSYHLCWIRIKNFLSAPARFSRGWRDPEYRVRALEKRTGLGRWWFSFNSRTIPALFWSLVQLPIAPLLKLVRSNRSLLLGLEKFCHFFWSDNGISHALFIGRRRPLYTPPPEDQLPRETKHKKQVWE